MRIRITFRDRELISYLPVNTNFYLAKLLAKMINKHDAYLQSLVRSHCRKGYKFDLYTFSQLIIPSRRIEYKKIAVYSPEMYWYISSPFHQFISLLVREFRIHRQVKIAGNIYKVAGFEFLKMPHFASKNEKFTCLSPITLTRNDYTSLGGKLSLNNYLLPDQSEYKERLIDSILNTLNRITSCKIKHIKFSLEFDKKYIKRKNNKISKLIAIEHNKKKPTYIRGVLAPFKVSSTPDILKLIYDTGLGSLTTMGFGMIQKVHQK
jgi:CRISPR-associated endoribonuclease Cas6